MSSENQKRAVEAVASCLQQAVGEQFQALYFFDEPAGQVPAELLIVVADSFWSTEAAEHAPFCRLRRAFTPVWQEVGSRFSHAPLLATTPGLANFTRLYPLFARDLRQGRLLAAAEASAAAALPIQSGAESLVEAGYWAGEFMRLSAVLAPGLMEPAAAAERLQELRGSVARRRGQPVAADEPPLQLLVELQERLSSSLAALPGETEANQPPLDGAPPLLPQLRAIYERGKSVLLLLPSLTAGAMTAVDWPRVAALFEEHYTELQVSTPGQFRLLLQQQQPLLYTLRAYHYLWGEDVVEHLEVERWRVLQDAARLPALTLTADLPGTYLTSSDVHRVVHDGHNRLLNIQLQHELLVRLLQLPQVKPPASLPDPDAPDWQRIGAVAAHLSWWSDHYLREMVRCGA
jgi:hypothetical protein